MKVIIAGSRDIRDTRLVVEAIKQAQDSGLVITEVVSGLAKGVDNIGQVWAWENGIPVKAFPAEWNKHGKSAGPIRNTQMAKYAEALIAVWDGKSKGTEHMILKAKSLGLKVFVNLAAPTPSAKGGAK